MVRWISTRPSLAPLSIATRGNSNYYIKLVDSVAGTTAGTFFIRSGDSLEVEVPLGTFEIRYAAGTTWYGENQLFGLETVYSRADENFSFRRTPDGYSGYTIELFLQPNGNMRTERLQAEDF